MGDIDFHKMELHEVAGLDDGTQIRRVPGGWIYTTYAYAPIGDPIACAHDWVPVSSVFVPHDIEFRLELSCEYGAGKRGVTFDWKTPKEWHDHFIAEAKLYKKAEVKGCTTV